jgi:hypothetical protein
MSERVIQSYIEDERQRCALLANALSREPELLMFCITSPYSLAEIDDARTRFAELHGADDFEDLM